MNNTLKDRIVKSIRSFWSKHSFEEYYQYARVFLRGHPQPLLTTSEKDDIDAYWAKFGIKWPDYSWFQMYYGVNGNKSPEFIPDPLAAVVLYRFYNPKEYIMGWDDKNMYERLLPIVPFPESLCHCIRGRYYDDNWAQYGSSDNSIHELASKIWERIHLSPEVIVKKTSNTHAGKGVKLLRFSSVTEIEILLKKMKTDFIMQKIIIQHPVMRQFCSTSVNIIRIVSFRYKDEVLLFPASIRYGVEGSITDVSFVEGKEIVHVMGINKDGSLNGRMASFDGDGGCISIKDKIIPSYQKILEIIQVAHKQMFYFDIIGWDFAIDDEKNPICIEYNVMQPGTILYQYVNGPFCGEYTDKFLEPLNTDLIRNTIPRRYRLW